MQTKPRYVTSTWKALEAILWMASKKPGFDIYHIVKAAYFADKYHVSTYGRPIVGDSYSAAPYGPLPLVMYGLLKREPIELLALDGNGEVPFIVDGRFRVTATRDPNLNRLSKTDTEALGVGVDHVAGMTFDAIYRETHDDPAYINADGSRMDYRDFISDEDPAKDKKAELISETAEFAVF